eukprot:scaffold107246_cov19-Tisochrysis_lutea.AAC.1
MLNLFFCRPGPGGNSRESVHFCRAGPGVQGCSMPPIDKSDIASQAARMVQAVNTEPMPGSTSPTYTCSCVLMEQTPPASLMFSCEIRPPISGFLEAISHYLNPSVDYAFVRGLLRTADKWYAQGCRLQWDLTLNQGAMRTRSNLLFAHLSKVLMCFFQLEVGKLLIFLPSYITWKPECCIFAPALSMSVVASRTSHVK